MTQLRILVVEDDPLTATMLETNFNFDGFKIWPTKVPNSMNERIFFLIWLESFEKMLISI